MSGLSDSKLYRKIIGYAYAGSYSPRKAYDWTACVHVIAGDKETGVIKRSANIFCNSIADCKVIMLPDLFHGEFSLNYPDRYVEFIKQCLIRNTGDN